MTTNVISRDAIHEAARVVAEADALLVTAGAGMSVNSGLPDFRSQDGFWRAYPPLRKLGLSFEQMAQPHWFESAPEMAWAWYGHRQQIYREASPHAGHALLRKWGMGKPGGHFVVTSNVDGHFYRADFDPAQILELHGDILRLQCTVPCCETVWQDDPPDLRIDMNTLRAHGALPRCPECGELARPNVLMFNDATWVRVVKARQEGRFSDWIAGTRGKRLAIVECGAGTAVATIRQFGERLARESSVTLIRINPGPDDEEDGDAADVTIRLPALRALTEIDAALPEKFRRQCELAAMPSPRPTQSELRQQTKEGLKSNPGGIISTMPGDYLNNLKFGKVYSKAWQVKLPSGSMAWVDKLDVSRTYLSMITGIPPKSKIDDEIRSAVDLVKTTFSGPEPVVIPPKLFDPASDEPILPPLRFAAQIVTFESVGEGDGSWMNLIWFAEIDDEKPLKAFVEEALAQVDWPTQATRYEI